MAFQPTQNSAILGGVILSVGFFPFSDLVDSFHPSKAAYGYLTLFEGIFFFFAPLLILVLGLNNIVGPKEEDPIPPLKRLGISVVAFICASMLAEGLIALFSRVF